VFNSAAISVVFLPDKAISNDAFRVYVPVTFAGHGEPTVPPMYEGSADRLVTYLLDGGSLKKEEIEKLKNLINSME